MKIELKMADLEVEMKIAGLRGAVALAGIGLLGACVAHELSLPPAERAWRGQLWGWLPYDLRPPTFERVRTTLWDPDNPEIIRPSAFGVGWSVNIPQAARRLTAFNLWPDHDAPTAEAA